MAPSASALGHAGHGCATRKPLCARSYAITARPLGHLAARRRRNLNVRQSSATSPFGAGPAPPRRTIAPLTSRESRTSLAPPSGMSAVSRAPATVAKAPDPHHFPAPTNTAPTDSIGPYPTWHDPEKIVSLDPYGAVVAEAFRDYLQKGYDIRPTIAVTKAHIDMPEIVDAIEAHRLAVDGKIVKSSREIAGAKAATE